jgi:hypothetical protein
MNGEVSLIVRVEGAGGPGNTVIDNTGGYTEFGTYTIFMLGDMTVYIGHYVQITSTLTGVIGTFELATASYDGTTWSTVTFVDWTPIEVESLTYQIYSLASASQEYYLDLFENESISQNWRYTDLNNFTSLGAFSREFRVPYTDRNQLALGALFDVNYDGGVNNYFHYKLPSEIRVDTLPIAKGYVRVRKVYQQQGKINEIELAFYAETPDLFKTIGEKKLKDLTDLPNLNEVVKFDNVTITTPERVWSLIDRGQLWSEQGQPGTRRISDSTTPLFAVDLTPAVRWDYLLEQIIADAGFELEASSLLTILAGYHMPWLNKSFLDTDDLGSQYAFRAYNSTTISLPNASGVISNFLTYNSLTEAFDNNANFDAATGVYTAPGGGLYTFHFCFPVQTTGYTGAGTHTRFLIYFTIDGVDYFHTDFFYQSSLTIDFIYGFNFPTGTTLQVKFRREIGYYSALDNGWIVAGDGTVSVLAGNGDLGNAMFELVGTKFKYGSTFIYNLNAPDMRQIDFLNDVIKMHNCAIVADRTNPNKISIVPYNSYVGSGNQLDWNAKLDISKDITIYATTELQKNKTTFTYTAGEDYLGKLYKDNNRTYGEYKAEGYTVNPDVPISSFVTGDNTVQLITRSTPSGNIPGTPYPIPQFINNQNEFVVPGPRALFASTAFNIQLFDDSVGVEAAVLTAVSSLTNYSVAQATITDFDLNFAPEIPPFQINANPYNNLFNLYWRNAMNELYSPNARIMEAYFALDLTDILTFQFSDILYVNNAQWRILEVSDYKVGQFESTKVKLIKYIDSEADCSGTPDSININGTVNFIDGAGDPVAATQSCCVRYGYEWSESDGECYAFNNQGDRPTNGITGTNTAPIPRNATTQPIDGNSRSVQQGVELSIADGNNNMLAVGDALKLTEPVRGNTMLGKNVLTTLPGMHVGGGWKLDDRTQAEGGTQYGVILFGSKDVLATSGDIIQPTVENTAAHLNIPDDSFWSVLLHVNVTDIAGSTTYNGLHMVTFQKVGSIAASTGVILINEDNGFATVNFAINIDTTTNTDEHRIEIVTTGTGYTYIFFTTVTLTYTAVR